MIHLKKILFSLLIVFCFSKCSESKKTNKPSKVTEKTFQMFFKKFSKDSVYQISNIKFPLPFSSFDIEENEEIILIKKLDWKFEDLFNDKEAYKRKNNAYKTKIEIIDSVRIKYIKSGIDNGIRVEYLFSFGHSKWNLVKITDLSN